MTKKAKFLFSGFYIASYLLFGILFISRTIDQEFLFSALIAVTINLGNLVIALVAFNFSAQKSNQEFVIFNLGGMIFRLFGMLIAILVILKFLNIDKVGFILVFFIFYFSQIAAEIGYFSSYAKRFKKS